MENTLEIFRKIQDYSIFESISGKLDIDESSEPLLELRKKLAFQIFQNLAKLNQGNDTEVKLDKNGLIIKDFPLIFGHIVNPTTGKKDAELTTAEYFVKRKEQVQEASSDRFSSSSNPTIVPEVAKCVVFYDLVSSDLCKPVIAMGLHLNEGSRSLIKRASSVLYNRARIFRILLKQRETYPNLPALDTIDFSKLKKKEEIDIMEKHIEPFSGFIEKQWAECKRAEKVPANLWRYLLFLSQDFSVYYGRVKILTDSVACIGTLHARIWFLKTILSIFDCLLNILCVKPLDEL